MERFIKLTRFSCYKKLKIVGKTFINNVNSFLIKSKLLLKDLCAS